MDRGALIVYDNNGVIWYNSGEYSGDIPPQIYPDGVPYMEIPFGSTKGKIILSVDVSSVPHKLITKDIDYKPSYEELENQILISEGVL